MQRAEKRMGCGSRETTKINATNEKQFKRNLQVSTIRTPPLRALPDVATLFRRVALPCDGTDDGPAKARMGKCRVSWWVTLSAGCREEKQFVRRRRPRLHVWRFENKCRLRVCGGSSAFMDCTERTTSFSVDGVEHILCGCVVDECW